MDLIKNRDKVIEIEKNLEKTPKEGEVWLHLGCGDRIWDNWHNIDKYNIKNPRVMQTDMYNLFMYPDNSIDGIYSSHSLEHLPIRHARLALKEWYRVLKPNSMLWLMIPDLEQICKNIINPNINFAAKYFWYLHTMYGWQTDSNTRNPGLDAEIDYGQFHTCGFTEELIKFYLNEDGYKVIDFMPYDGWNTPSLYIQAIK